MVGPEPFERKAEIMNVTYLECGACGQRHEAQRLHNLCTQCGKPLLVRYDFERAGRSLTKESLRQRNPDLWRYREVLPVERVLALAHQQIPGDVIGVRLEPRRGGALNYEIRVLTPAGQIRELVLDARTGAFVKVED